MNSISYNMQGLLNAISVEATAPVRIDMGGTLDLPTFNYLLRSHRPLTFNIALNCRTSVSLRPYQEGRVKVTSTEVGETDFPAGEAPYDHALGLMFAAADYFCVSGLHILVESTSPPKSGLGGSSSACVALVTAISRALETAAEAERLTLMQTAEIAYLLEQATMHESCGIQDQLAATFGGVNVWHWHPEPQTSRFVQQALTDEKLMAALDQQVLVAYCGIQHESRVVNRRWVEQFISGQERRAWHEIAQLTSEFIRAVREYDFQSAISAMNQETIIRLKLTPEVLDEVGAKLFALALAHGAGARFAGAGAGGCVWALCPPDRMNALRESWQTVLAARNHARLLNAGIDRRGVECVIEEKSDLA